MKRALNALLADHEEHDRDEVLRAQIVAEEDAEEGALRKASREAGIMKGMLSDLKKWEEKGLVALEGFTMELPQMTPFRGAFPPFPFPSCLLFLMSGADLQPRALSRTSNELDCFLKFLPRSVWSRLQSLVTESLVRRLNSGEIARQTSNRQVKLPTRPDDLLTVFMARMFATINAIERIDTMYARHDVR